MPAVSSHTFPLHSPLLHTSVTLTAYVHDIYYVGDSYYGAVVLLLHYLRLIYLLLVRVATIRTLLLDADVATHTTLYIPLILPLILDFTLRIVTTTVVCLPCVPFLYVHSRALHYLPHHRPFPPADYLHHRWSPRSTSTVLGSFYPCLRFYALHLRLLPHTCVRFSFLPRPLPRSLHVLDCRSSHVATHRCFTTLRLRFLRLCSHR